MKTAVATLTAAEIAAASDLAREIGTFQFLDSVEEKGPDRARHHAGLTVQRAIAIMTARGLDPFRYAFICHDSWDATPAVPAQTAIPEVVDEERGAVISPAIPARAPQPEIPAGDRYSFRADQLALFIARGQEARLAALEARLPA